jgi:1-acyl-sn-glycerol-3-phosphate acyltransferase
MHLFVQAFVRIVFKCALFLIGVKYHVIGLENVPKDKPILYIANHRSAFDAAFAYALIPGPTSFIAKKELKKALGIAQWMYFLNCYFLNRDDIRDGLNMILFSIERIKGGYSIFLSPEGTRNAADTLLPFRDGCFKIAQKTDCLIVPVVLNNTEEIFENHMPWIKKAKVCVEFGSPIDITSMNDKEKKAIGSHVKTIIQTIYEKNQANI